MFDSNLMFRAASAGNLTASGSAALTLSGPMLTPMVLRVHVPQSEASTGLAVTIDTSRDGGSTFEEQFEVVNSGGSTGTGYGTGSAANGRKGDFYLPIKTPYKYLRATWTVTGTPSSAGFGAVAIGFEAAARDNK